MQYNLKASHNPLAAINKLAWEGQPDHLKMYRSGYEQYFNELVNLNLLEPYPRSKAMERNTKVLKDLGELLQSAQWIKEDEPGEKHFDRTILAITEPVEELSSPLGCKKTVAGPQIVVARWGNGFKSPIHGHRTGFLHEEIISGKLKVNTYRIIDHDKRIVRLTGSTIIEEGTFLSDFTLPLKDDKLENYVHSFESIGNSVSLHYLPEYNRDGMGNTFEVEYFEDTYLIDETNTIRIDSMQAIYSKVGDVILVRSENVPEYGDHFIYITGHPIVKKHGLRPQDIAFDAPHITMLLDRYEMQTGLVLLKLNKEATEAFIKFHNL